MILDSLPGAAGLLHRLIFTAADTLAVEGQDGCVAFRDGVVATFREGASFSSYWSNGRSLFVTFASEADAILIVLLYS